MVAGAGAIGIFRKLLLDKYDLYCQLAAKRQELMDIGDEAAEAIVSAQLKSLRYDYLLTDEMWVPSWLPAFAVLSLVICVICVVCVAVMQKKHVTSELADDFSDRKE